MIPATIDHKIAGYSKSVRRMGKDRRLLATHISLFTALFVQWQRNGFISPFHVTRKELMGISRIASVATSHNCIRQLDAYGFIIYQPSFNPKAGSLVYWREQQPDIRYPVTM